MRKQIETHFPIVVPNNCLQNITDIAFGIAEPDEDKGGKSIIVVLENADFEVINLLQKEVCFWAIDDCTFTSLDVKRCDFAIFDDETFAFAEIKRSKMKNRQQSRSNAVEQLDEILNFCKDKLDFTHYRLLAIIALSFSKSFPIARTRKQDAEVHFFNKHRAQLLEGNSITFPFAQ